MWVQMPPIIRIAEVVFETDDIEASVVFYRDVLRLPLERRDDKTAWFRWNDQLVAFMDRSLSGTETGTGAHTTFEVARRDFPEVLAALSTYSIRHDPPRTFDDGATGVYLTDPNGNMIEVYCREPSPDAEQLALWSGSARG
jgi:catechol-2,3-dioxygenase